MARVLKGSHSFTCTPRAHPLTEWTIAAFYLLPATMPHSLVVIKTFRSLVGATRNPRSPWLCQCRRKPKWTPPAERQKFSLNFLTTFFLFPLFSRHLQQLRSSLLAHLPYLALSGGVTRPLHRHLRPFTISGAPLYSCPPGGGVRGWFASALSYARGSDVSRDLMSWLWFCWPWEW